MVFDSDDQRIQFTVCLPRHHGFFLNSQITTLQESS